ncbi:MAG TPA: hypothetical protein VFJ71_11480 [Candidatus Limnocylindrales bacterium]|nr:hypothetical protein [Candidatus Limnocylindrales bacterium]
MTTDRAFELAIRDWLDDGRDTVPRAAIDAVHLAVATTPQERPMPWRRSSLALPGRRAIGAVAAVVALAVLAGIVWRPSPNPIAASPSALPSVMTSGSPAASSGVGPSSPPSTRQSAVPLAPIGYAGNGTIAFSRDDPVLGDTTTWLIDPSGEHEVPLVVRTGWGGATELPGSGCCGLFAPDGRTIAVAYDEVNPSRAPGTLRTTTRVDLEGTWIGWVPEFCGACVSIEGINYVPRAWSPDGHILAVEIWSETDPDRDGIHLAPYGGSTLEGPDWTTQVTGNNRDVPVAFSPDGTELLFVRVDARERRGPLMALTIVTGSTRTISPPGAFTFADGSFGPSASWSADGSKIAFAATDDRGSMDHMRVWVADRDGSNRTALTEPDGFVTSARFSPDGAWIAFDRPGTGGRHDEWIIKADGRAATNLTADFDPGVCCGRWSPDSRALLVAGTNGHDDASDLLIVPIDGSAIRQVTTTPGLYTDFSWGPVSR